MSRKIAMNVDGPTPRRAIRVDTTTWDTAVERATAEHRSVSDVVRIALRAYADGRYHATEPRVKLT